MLARPLAILTSLLVLAFPVCAHVGLDAPFEDVILVPGTVYLIQWSVIIQHNTTGFDLHYSINGPAGPWIPIAIGLDATGAITGATFSYHWTVPNTASTQVHVRVTQVNVAGNYSGASGNDNTIIPEPVTSTTPSISALSGGVHDIALNFPATFSGDTYVIGGSLTGPVTGSLPNVASFAFGAIYLPIIPDTYTLWTTSPPPPLTGGFTGSLDAFGAASATLTVPANLPPSMIGVTAYHGCVLVQGGVAILAGNPIAVTISP